MRPGSTELQAQQVSAPSAAASRPGRDVQSRVAPPAADVTLLAGHRPISKTITTGAAGNDTPVSRPLGYQVKALTLIAPGSIFNTTANTDSVYVAVDDIALGAAGTPTNPNFVELPPGTFVTYEEVDPGWFHVMSPTAAQRLMVSAGGSSPGK